MRTETLAPPSDPALEAAVLGAMLCERDAVPTTLALLRGNADIFYPDANRRIFRAMQSLHNEGQAVDLVTVASRLRELGQLEKVGGPGYVAGLTSHIQSSANLPTHCLLLVELFTKRRIAEVARQLLAQAYDPLHDPHELLSKAQGGLNTLHDSLQMRRPQTVAEQFDATVDEIVNATSAPAGITGVPSGLWGLDRITGGWQPSDLIILAARPGMGKTSAALAMACMAEAAGVPGFFASLEMSNNQLIKKMVATELGYTTSQLTKGAGLSPAEAESIRERATGTRHSKLVLDDTPGLSITEFRAKLTKAVQEHGVRMAYVDYLQLMSGDKGGNRQQEIGSISRGLKLIAKELHIPIMALAQLSRAVETRGGDKKPQLSDIREAGDVEQDADVVIFPYRPEYYGVTQDEMGNATAGLTELIIAKHRNGATATGDDAVMVRSNMATGRYEDIEENKPHTVASSPAYNARQLPASEFETSKAPF